ncbi:hypothetical protein [Inmirania thermothiophila]|uniref:SmpA/OmlA family protein n=1 Tax=Inmirania thermothiophila TaxID=1750597 RepID=A0A3N1Y2C3_9GAMM|nr:hypothetical protein [Inmirania thermothiophila]ROR32668.1 hypothetical protein EDC57_1874 [Inmirania thermothiophila]
MKGLRTQAAVLALLATIAAAPARAATLLIEAIAQEPPNSPEGLPRPTRGMTMDEVQARFGVPQVKMPPVGDPPITRWVYPRYTVYFEGRYVIDTVIHR